MPCDHQLITLHLLDYIEGRLSGELRSKCEEALLHCPDCRASHEQALVFAGLSHEWQTQAVPKWHRTRFAVQPRRQQFNWLSWSALATSCLTLLLVVFQLEISTGDGLHISFGGAQRERQMQAALATQLEQFRSDSTQNIKEQLAEFSLGQNTANRLLLSEWLDKGRTERSQDMEFIMTTWESQRFADRQRTEEGLSYLARNQIQSDQYLNELLQNSASWQGDAL